MDARAPNYELAESDYMSGMKYKDIADKYSVSINTVKSWKKRYAWDRKKGAHKNEKGCTQNKRNISNKNEPVVKEVEEVMENTELTDKQRLFLLFLVKSHNATKAYMKAFGCNEITARVNASRMLTNANIKNEYEKLNQSKLNKTYLQESDIFEKYMDIAFADMGDYVTFGHKKIPQWTYDNKGERVPVIDPNTEMQQVIEYDYISLKNSDDVDTSIISEISKGKNGIKIKRADQMRALDWLSQHMNMATDEQKARLELLRVQKAKIEGENRSDYDGNEERINNISNILIQMKPVKEDEVYE